MYIIRKNLSRGSMAVYLNIYLLYMYISTIYLLYMSSRRMNNEIRPSQHNERMNEWVHRDCCELESDTLRPDMDERVATSVIPRQNILRPASGLVVPKTWHHRNRWRPLRVKSHALAQQRSGVRLCGRLFWVSDSLALWLWLDCLIEGSEQHSNQRWWWGWGPWWLRRRSSSTQTLALVSPNPQAHSTELDNWA